jgi:hypothetical protein
VRWTERDVRGGEVVTLPVHGASFPVDAVYDGIGQGDGIDGALGCWKSSDRPSLVA